MSWVTQIIFQSHNGQTRVLGRDHFSNRKVNYEYNAFQPFVGMFTYELDETTVAIGAYEDDCHNAPKRLPYGIESWNLPSMEEVNGEHNVSSMTWVNLDDGTSSQENELLDKVLLQEVEEDEDVEEPSADAHIINVDFVEIEVELNINTPPEGLYDDDEKPEDLPPSQADSIMSME